MKVLKHVSFIVFSMSFTQVFFSLPNYLWHEFLKSLFDTIPNNFMIFSKLECHNLCGTYLCLQNGGWNPCLQNLTLNQEVKT